MQRLPDSTDESTKCAALVAETVAAVSRTLRRRAASRHGVRLAPPMFIVMMFLRRHPKSSLSELAKRSPVKLPAMSRFVDGLVEEGLVSRETDQADRRRVLLELTEEGKAWLEEHRQHIESVAEEQLLKLTVAEREQVSAAMLVLRRAFQRGEDGEGERGTVKAPEQT